MASIAHLAFDIVSRSVLSSDPPARRTRQSNHATLLVSWWCTIFALFIILLRLCGRFVRSEMLFREDKIAAFSIIPLLLRMAGAHVLLLFGTNNADINGLSASAAANREIGSKVVLATRILYALFIWMAKFTVAEFLRRIATAVWTRGYEQVLRGIRWFLVLTFVGIIIATLAECHPFNHYWQVTPNPGPRCRNGFAQVLTMGTADIVTDILLIAFPIPIVIRSTMPLKRKMALVTLFSLSFFLIAITAYRMYAIIDSAGRQQLRTLWASIEILAAAAVSNAIVIGSFVRDRGVKKTRYKPSSTRNDSVSGVECALQPSTVARKMTLQHWGSDEDLFRTLGCRVGSAEEPLEFIPRAAPRARQASDTVMLDPVAHSNKTWIRPDGGSGSLDDSSSTTQDSDIITVEKVPAYYSSGSNSSGPPALQYRPTAKGPDDMNVFDTSNELQVPHKSTPVVRTYDFATQPRQRPSESGSTNEVLRNSGPNASSTRVPPLFRQASQPRPPVLHHPDYRSYQRSGTDQVLGDVGGLLSGTPVIPPPAARSKDGRRSSLVAQVMSRERRRSSQQSTSVTTMKRPRIMDRWVSGEDIATASRARSPG